MFYKKSCFHKKTSVLMFLFKKAAGFQEKFRVPTVTPRKFPRDPNNDNSCSQGYIWKCRSDYRQTARKTAYVNG